MSLYKELQKAKSEEDVKYPFEVSEDTNFALRSTIALSVVSILMASGIKINSLLGISFSENVGSNSSIVYFILLFALIIEFSTFIIFYIRDVRFWKDFKKVRYDKQIEEHKERIIKILQDHHISEFQCDKVKEWLDYLIKIKNPDDFFNLDSFLKFNSENPKDFEGVFGILNGNREGVAHQIVNISYCIKHNADYINYETISREFISRGIKLYIPVFVFSLSFVLLFNKIDFCGLFILLHSHSLQIILSLSLSLLTIAFVFRAEK